MLVFLIAAISVDGRIAETTDQVSTSWNSPEDKKWFRERTKQAGTLVMGRTTFDTFHRSLPDRQLIVYTRTVPEANEFAESEVRYTNLEPAALIQDLKNKNCSEVAICGGSSIYSMFTKAGLIDKMYLTLEPKVFGKGVPLFNDNVQAKLHLVSCKNLSDQTLLLEYDVVKN